MLKVLMDWNEPSQMWIMKNPQDNTFLQDLRDCSRVRSLFKDLDKHSPNIYTLEAYKDEK